MATDSQQIVSGIGLAIGSGLWETEDMAKPDWQIVQEILERSKGKNTMTTAKVIVEALGKRIRQRRRDSEDVNQAAARTVRELTDGK
jgi:hypothetical protein